MNRSRTIALALLGFTPALGACDAFQSFDEAQPAQEISPDRALGTIQGYESLVLSVYDYLQNEDHYGSLYVLAPDAMADNIAPPVSSANRLITYTRNEEGAHVGDEIYGLAYSAINEANLILAGIDEVEIEGDPAAATRRRNRIKGEALFLRALNYFDLVRALAYEPGREVNGFNLGVVIRTSPTTTLEDAEPRPRNTNAEVYQQIIADLTAAAPLLQGTARGGPQFASRAAALALLARAQLYAGNLAEAEAAAQQAIDVSGAKLVVTDGNAANGNEIVNSWTSRSAPPESIFSVQLEAGQDGNSTNANNSLQAITDPTSLSISFDAVVTQDLLNAYSSDDARRGLYATGKSAQDETVTYVRKYTGTTALNVDWSPVLRLPEMYYIIAESRALQGNDSGAFQALNTVRRARGLSDVNSGSAIDAVLLERRLEFAFEGHRFFDLKRRARDIPKPQASFAALAYTDYRVLSPIPPTQIDINPVLVQNPGY